MMGYGMHEWSWAWMLTGGIFWVAVLGIIVWAVTRVAALRQESHPQDAGDVLDQRYAAGDIDRETYQRMLADLRPG